jgi:hypothetical protein
MSAMPPRTVIGWPWASRPPARFMRPSGAISTIEFSPMRSSTARQVWSRTRVTETTWRAMSLKKSPIAGRRSVFSAAGTTPWRAIRHRNRKGTKPIHSHS